MEEFCRTSCATGLRQIERKCPLHYTSGKRSGLEWRLPKGCVESVCHVQSDSVYDAE